MRKVPIETEPEGQAGLRDVDKREMRSPKLAVRSRGWQAKLSLWNTLATRGECCQLCFAVASPTEPVLLWSATLDHWAMGSKICLRCRTETSHQCSGGRRLMEFRRSASVVHTETSHRCSGGRRLLEPGVLASLAAMGGPGERGGNRPSQDGEAPEARSS